MGIFSTKILDLIVFSLIDDIFFLFPQRGSLNTFIHQMVLLDNKFI